MTTAVLALVTLAAAAMLVGVLWSVVRMLHAESANARLRREGVPVTGTVVDNTMTSTAQRRLHFSPVVEFRALTGQNISGPAQEQAATSWARGTTVQVCYDADDPHRFVLAGPPSRSHLVANMLVAALIVAFMAGTILAMHHIWSEFRYDRAGRPGNPPASITESD